MQQLAVGPARGEDVQLINQFPIYEIGGALRLLKSVCDQENAGAFQQMFALWSARRQLSPLLDGEPLALNYCKAAASELLQIIWRHERTLSAAMSAANLGSPPQEVPEIPRWEISEVRTRIEIFEHQFSAELQKLAVYAVPKRGIFDLEGLVDSADLHIHEAVRTHVPEFALSEFRRAGRCLAFGLYSASGFHSARAVESVLRNYHQSYLPNKFTDNLTMGQMASALDDMHKAKKKASRLPKENTIRHIRDFASFDRNPLIHKTVDLEEIDAQTLFNSAVGLIVEMMREIVEDASAGFTAIQEELGSLPGTTPNEVTS